MSDTPKFTVVDRRKFRADEESAPSETQSAATTTTAADESYGKLASSPTSAPRLTLVEAPAAKPEPSNVVTAPVAVVDEPETFAGSEPEALDQSYDEAQLPPAPTAEEASFQKTAYDQAAERLDDLVRAQNPGAPPTEKIGFEHLVQQLYLSAMMQMGAGTPEGQRPRIDILGARQTIDLLGVVKLKTAGNLSAHETRTLDTVLFELHATFLELTRMITAKPAAPMPPPPGAKR